MGPAFIVGALQFGSGSTISAVSAGASFGYGIIWLIVLSTFFWALFLDMSVRIGMACPGTSIQTIKSVLGKPVGLLTGLAIGAIAFSAAVGNLLGASLGLSLLSGIDSRIWVTVVVAAILSFLWTRRAYSIVEKIALAVIGLMVVSFAITAVASGPDWVQAARGLVPGAFGGDVVLAMALLGTNFSIFSAFYMTYTIREKGTRKEQYRDTTLADTVAATVATGLMTILIIVAGAAVVPSGESIETGADVARILEPVLGSAAVVVFGLGLFAAGFSSVTGGVAAGGTTLGDSLGVGDTLRTRNVRLVATVGILFSFSLAIIFGEAPIQVIILVNALAVLLYPFLATVILLLANNKSLMGTLRNRPWQNILGAMGWIIVTWGAVTLAHSLITGG